MPIDMGETESSNEDANNGYAAGLGGVRYEN